MNRGIFALVLATSFALEPRAMAAAPVAAPDDAWATSFQVGPLATHLDVADGAYMLVPAGTPSPDRDAAAAALANALRASGRARVVMDASPIGNADTLDDEAVVAKAATLPVDRIVVLRVFEGGAGQPPRAVATIYDKDGEAVSAFVVAAGSPLPAGQTDTGAGAGLSEETAEAAEDAVRAESSPDEAMAEYERKFLHFKRFAAVDSRGWVVARWSRLYRGKYDEPVRGKEFYEIIGRDDLKKKYQRRMGAKWGILVGGVLAGGTLTTLGLVLFLKDGSVEGPDFGEDDPLGQGDPNANRPIGEGGTLALMGVGVGVLVGAVLTGTFLKPHPVRPPEARKLADEYNRKLRRRLGIPEPTASRPRVNVSVAAGPSGGGVALRGRF